MIRRAFVLGAGLIAGPAWAKSSTSTKPAARKPAPPLSPAGSSATVITLFDGKSMGAWKATAFGGEGPVSVKRGSLVLGRGEPLTGVTWGGRPLPQDDYQLDLEARRVSGSDFFCGLTFAVGEAFLTLVLGGWGGSLVGLSSLDDKDASENETTQHRTFVTGRWYRVRVMVGDGRVQAFIDDERVVDVLTKGRRLSLRPEVLLSRPLGVASFATVAELRKLRLTVGSKP